jgi:hypothetical protein
MAGSIDGQPIKRLPLFHKAFEYAYFNWLTVSELAEQQLLLSLDAPIRQVPTQHASIGALVNRSTMAICIKRQRPTRLEGGDGRLQSRRW